MDTRQHRWQIDDVVFGAEANINRTSVHQTAVNSVTRGYWVNNGGNLYGTTLYTNSQGTIDMAGYFTMRGRLGWAFGNFLPYIAAGVAFAYAPYRVTEAGHLHVIPSGGIPLALFLLFRGYRRGSRGHAVNWALR